MEISAVMKGGGGLGNGKLRVTDQRLVFERRTMMGRAGDVSSFPLPSIQTAQLRGLLTKTLEVKAGSTKLEFTSGLMDNSEAGLKAIADLLQRAISGVALRAASATPDPSSQTPASPAPAALPYAPLSAPTAWIAELRELGELRTAGVLSDEEFATAKAKLLGGGYDEAQEKTN